LLRGFLATFFGGAVSTVFAAEVMARPLHPFHDVVGGS
jgi:hypothetical protein